MSEKKITQIQLPKIFHNRPIRIRSSSKDTRRAHSGKNFHTVSNEKNRKFKSPHLKQKSSPVKSNHLESQMTQVQQIETEPKNCLAEFERNYQDELMKLDRIAQLFDPKNFMKVKGKKENEVKIKENRKVKLGSNFFEHQKLRKVNKKKKEMEKSRGNEEEYWNRVNESMILASCRSEEEASKDLREIMETFITE